MSLSTVIRSDHSRRVWVDTLFEHPFARGLTKQDISTVANLFHYKKVPANITFIRAEDFPNSIYLIVSGGVRLYTSDLNGKEVTLSFQGPGEILGDLAYFDEAPRLTNVQSLKNTEMLMTGYENFRKIFTSYPIVARNLLSILAKRIRYFHQQLIFSPSI